MKAVFIAYNQAHEDDVLTAMRELDIKGFTGWPSLVGAGQRRAPPRQPCVANAQRGVAHRD